MAIGPIVPCEKLPDGLLPPLRRVNVPTGDVRSGVQNLVKEIPDQLREMFKISHLMMQNGKILHADGQELERFMPKEFRSNYT